MGRTLIWLDRGTCSQLFNTHCFNISLRTLSIGVGFINQPNQTGRVTTVQDAVIHSANISLVDDYALQEKLLPVGQKLVRDGFRKIYDLAKELHCNEIMNHKT